MRAAADPSIGALHALGLTGAGVSIGHLDTGVDGKHPALARAVREFARFDRKGLLDSSDPSDLEGHGTHVAGISCGGTVFGYPLGIAPGASLFSAAVIHGGSVLLRILEGLAWALARDVRILLLPFGMASSTPVFDSILEAAWRRGILTVVPVGNGGAGAYRTPGAHPLVLSVGAAGAGGSVPPFSGSAHRDGHLVPFKPDLIAPGVDITSAESGGSIAARNGTSMAAAFVAGVAALLLEAHPKATAVAIFDALVATADPLLTTQRHRSAHGLVNPIRALEWLAQNASAHAPGFPTAALERFVDLRLARELRNSPDHLAIEAIAGGCGALAAIAEVAAEIGEQPQWTRTVGLGDAAALFATRRFLLRLQDHPAISWLNSTRVDDCLF